MCQPFVPAATRWGPQAVVPYRGQAEGAEGQALVLPVGLSWSLQAGSHGGLPASPRSRARWGHWCQLGGVQEPSPEAHVQRWVPQQPGTPCVPVPAHSPGVPSPGIPRWPQPGHSPPEGSDTLTAAFYSLALPQLTFLPRCPGTCRQCGSGGPEQSRSSIYPTAGPGRFCSWYCHSPGAEERGGGNLCVATAVAARNGTRQCGGGGLWEPPVPGHGSAQEAGSQQAASGEEGR